MRSLSGRCLLFALAATGGELRAQDAFQWNIPALTWADPTLSALEDQALVPMFGTDPVELGMKGREEAFLHEIARDTVYERLVPRADAAQCRGHRAVYAPGEFDTRFRVAERCSESQFEGMTSHLFRHIAPVALISALCMSANHAGAQNAQSAKAAPVFLDGKAQVVPAFQDSTKWIRQDLWVETDFDTDHDGKKDRVHVDVTRPAQTATDGLKVPIVYGSSPYYAGTARDDVDRGRSPRARRTAAGAPVQHESAAV